MSAMQVELVYEKTCPNINAARAQLLRAFVQAGITPRWQEWEVNSPHVPSHVHGYGSPTILVNGQDISGNMAAGEDYCCRIYSLDERTNKGVPLLADIVRALKTAQQTPTTKNRFLSWRLNGAWFPAVGVALLPKLVCPACWPAYAGLLSSLGIGFFDYTPYLLPFTGIFLVIAVAALAYRAKQRRGYKPLLLGSLAAGMILIGKFYFDNDAAMYSGLALLVMASLWNSWPKPKHAGVLCPACVTAGQEN
jgi:mercuric ion transport protein